MQAILYLNSGLVVLDSDCIAYLLAPNEIVEKPFFSEILSPENWVGRKYIF